MSNVSLIIPTYNRVFFLDRIFRSLIAQDISKLKEVVVIDSNSTDGTKDLINLYQDDSPLNIIYEHVDNSVSLKRNRGIQVASSEYLIFIDDDCVPLDDFISKHINSCYGNSKTINCGNVYFEDNLVESSNYIRYRNSRHIPYLCEQHNEKKLDFRSIVTMNMSFKKSDILKYDLFFNEKFIGYGMEDNEFGYCATKAGFNIVCSNAAIVHIENKNALEYAKKIYHTSRDGVKRFKDIHPEAVEKLRYSFFFEEDYPHKNIFSRFYTKLFRMFFNIKIARFILIGLTTLDSIKGLSFRPLYMYVYATYYKQGVKDRSTAYKDIKETSLNWYKENV